MTRARLGGRRTLVIGVAVAAVMLALGAFLSFLGRPAPTSSTPDNGGSALRPAASGESAGPAAESAGVPVGFARDEDGAVAAAVAYATAAQRWLYFSDDEIAAAIAEIATPVAGPRLAEDVLGEVRIAREELSASPGRVWWLVRPLAWRVEASSRDEATVAVWVVTVLSAEGVAAPQSEWMTVTVELAWIDDDWRVDAVRDTPGPTPLTGPQDEPWDTVPFDRALDGFTRIDGEPVP